MGGLFGENVNWRGRVHNGQPDQGYAGGVPPWVWLVVLLALGLCAMGVWL